MDTNRMKRKESSFQQNKGVGSNHNGTNEGIWLIHSGKWFDIKLIFKRGFSCQHIHSAQTVEEKQGRLRVGVQLLAYQNTLSSHLERRMERELGQSACTSRYIK